MAITRLIQERILTLFRYLSVTLLTAFGNWDSSLFASLKSKNYNQTLIELKIHFSERRAAALVYKLEKCMMQLVLIMPKVIG